MCRYFSFAEEKDIFKNSEKNIKELRSSPGQNHCLCNPLVIAIIYLRLLLISWIWVS